METTPHHRLEWDLPRLIQVGKFTRPLEEEGESIAKLPLGEAARYEPVRRSTRLSLRGHLNKFFFRRCQRLFLSRFCHVTHHFNTSKKPRVNYRVPYTRRLHLYASLKLRVVCLMFNAKTDLYTAPLFTFSSSRSGGAPGPHAPLGYAYGSGQTARCSCRRCRRQSTAASPSPVVGVPTRCV